MRCPKCFRKLTLGTNKQYTNLYEHVCDPNDEYVRPFRNTYVCSCNYGKCGFWSEDGEFFLEDFDTFYHKYKMAGKKTSALFSYDWFTDYELKLIKVKYKVKNFLQKFLGGH